MRAFSQGILQMRLGPDGRSANGIGPRKRGRADRQHRHRRPETLQQNHPQLWHNPKTDSPAALHSRKNDLFFRRFVIMLNASIDSRMTWIRAEQFLRQTNDLLA
jgi:hypothetical protein